MTTVSSVSLPDIISGLAGNLCERTKRVPKRLELTSKESFIFPFEHTVIQGLISGERNEGWFGKAIRKASGRKAVNVQYSNDSERRELCAAIQDLFNAAYGFGTVLGRMDGLRDDNGKIARVETGQGEQFVYILMQGLNICGDQSTARNIWGIYASGNPRLYNF